MWKVTQKSVLMLSWTTWVAPNGLSPLWCLDILFLAKSFDSSLFFWVKRSGNAAAHEAAKYALESFISFCLCSDNLPTKVASTCKEDGQAFLLSV